MEAVTRVYVRDDGDAAWIRAGQWAWGEEGGFGRDVAS